MESPAGGGPPKRFRSSPRNPQRCGRFLLVVFLSGCAAPAAKSASSFPREETQRSGRICPKEEEGEGGRGGCRGKPGPKHQGGQGRAGQGRKPSVALLLPPLDISSSFVQVPPAGRSPEIQHPNGRRPAASQNTRQTKAEVLVHSHRSFHHTSRKRELLDLEWKGSDHMRRRSPFR